jgi:hypothetical protein
MLDEHALRILVYKAIDSHPPRFTRRRPSALPADVHHAEGAYDTYLTCIALALGGRYPMGYASTQEVAAWRSLHQALGTAISQAAATLDEPDYDAALGAVRDTAQAHGLAARRVRQRPLSMQERILGALTDIGQQAGHQVSIQPQYANTGRIYYSAGTGLTVLAEAAYHFDPDSCGLYFTGPAIEASGLRDSPPQFRYEKFVDGRRLSFYALRYTDGDRITAMLDLLTRALTPTHSGPTTDEGRPQ